ncbi:cell division protein FtsL [Gluconacetobacter tumulisoli]|uniref:ABC transporter permease n=1 Tax=Gluconacetobacter tumulisoli TaxID=1286189 RepID=A0A7W4PN21_9PROT|nr:ABC transporter permease [Gluconacetobacter tumulisoli]MBB2200411.1 ABC transporter permease [Gluconacetobacter tumulisoli]
MIRSFTFLCAVMAGLSGLFLYSKKHQTTLLDQQISRIVADTQHIREQTAMMRAEWALLNQPDRLGTLSARFLPGIRPMAPTQFIQMASLADHLPAPGSKPLPVANPRATIGATLAAAASPLPPAETAARVASGGTVPAAPTALPPHLTAEEPVRVAAAHRPVAGGSAGSDRPTRTERPVMMAEAASPPVQEAALHTIAPHPARPAAISPDLTHNIEHRAALTVARAQRPVLPPAAAGPITRMAADHPPRPAPIAVAAWRPAAPPAPYQEARGYGRGSSLGFTRSGALPPPVPVSN